MNGVAQECFLRGGRVRGGQEVIFWLTALLFLFLFLGSAPLANSESVHAESVREMLLTGDYLHSSWNWQYCFSKGLIFQWITLPFFKLFGSCEMAVRLPAALAALGVLAGLRLLSKELFNARTALLSCWLMLGCWSFLFTGRNASPDMAGMAAAIWAAAWFFHTEHKDSFWSCLIFYLFCFSGVLFNGVSVLVMPLATILPCVFSEKKWRKYLSWKNLLAFLIAGGAAGAFIYFTVIHGEDQKTTLTALLQILVEFEKTDSWKEYIVNFPRVLLPWTPFLIPGAAGIIAEWHRVPPRIRKSFCGTAAGMLLLLLLPVALWQPVKWDFFITAVPFGILFAVGGLTRYGRAVWNRWAFTVLYYLCMAAASLFAGSLLCWPLWENLAEYDPDPALVIAPALAGAAAWYALFLDHRENSAFSGFIGLPHRIGSSVFALTILSGSVFSVMIPVIQMDFRTGKTFFTELQQKSEKLFPGETFPVVTTSKEAVEGYLFYSASDTPVYLTADLIHAAEKLPGKQVVFILKKRHLEQLTAQAAKLQIKVSAPLLTERHHRWNTSGADGSFTAYLITLPLRNKK